MTTFAISLSAFTAPEFWIGVGILASVYGIFSLGLQLNLGLTGLVNFGQVGFMAIGAYSMGILVVDAGWAFIPAIIAATAITMAFGLLIGAPSLRLRADYLAIVTITFAEIVRYTAQNARDLTGGNQGLLGYDGAWLDFSDGTLDVLQPLGLGSEPLVPLLLVSWVVLIALALVLWRAKRSPWGRVLQAIREDEDAARALGKNTFAYKLQSLSIAAGLGAIAGYFLALDLAFLVPTEFDSVFTFIGYAGVLLGGLGSYRGVVLGTVVIWILLEGTRFLELPLTDEDVAAFRFMLVGAVLIALMAFRPQGAFGKREEMVLSD